MVRVYLNQQNLFGCGMYRAYYPLLHCYSELAKHGICLESRLELAAEETDYQTFIFHRCPSDTLAFHVDKLQDSGKRICHDVDDLLTDIPDHLYSQERNPWGLSKMMDLCNELWVSNEQLKAAFSREHKTRVLPNLIDANCYPLTPRSDSDTIRILWAGSSSHDKDLALVTPAIEQLTSEYGMRLQFIFFGWLPDCFCEYFRPNQSPYALFRAKEEYCDNIIYIPPVPFHRYYPTLQSLQPDIALAPLYDCPFNRCRSNLKYLEMSCAGAATIASDINVYSAPCVLTDDWYSSIKSLIDNDSLRKRIAEQQRADVVANYSWQSSKKQLWVNAFLENT